MYIDQRRRDGLPDPTFRREMERPAGNARPEFQVGTISLTLTRSSGAMLLTPYATLCALFESQTSHDAVFFGQHLWGPSRYRKGVMPVRHASQA